MDPTVTTQATRPGTPREKTPGNTRATTPRDILLLSPGIYDNYSPSRSTKSVTSERMTINKNPFTEIRKFPKKDKESKVSDPKQPDSNDKESDNDSSSSRTLSNKYNGTNKISPNKKNN